MQNQNIPYATQTPLYYKTQKSSMDCWPNMTQINLQSPKADVLQLF